MFEKISIIGRVAYAICSLEEYLNEQKYNIEEWELLLEKLWSFSKMNYIDEYCYKVIECIPYCVLDDNATIDDLEYITESEFLYLYKLYKSCSNIDIIDIIISSINDMISSHLYTTNEPPAKYSLEIIEKELYPVLQKHLKYMLPIKQFEIYSINDNSCWGKMHSRNILYNQ